MLVREIVRSRYKMTISIYRFWVYWYWFTILISFQSTEKSCIRLKSFLIAMRATDTLWTLKVGTKIFITIRRILLNSIMDHPLRKLHIIKEIVRETLSQAQLEQILRESPKSIGLILIERGWTLIATQSMKTTLIMAMGLAETIVEFNRILTSRVMDLIALGVGLIVELEVE
jgi:hypothetical protein